MERQLSAFTTEDAEDVTAKAESVAKVELPQGPPAVLSVCTASVSTDTAVPGAIQTAVESQTSTPTNKSDPNTFTPTITRSEFPPRERY